MEFRVSLGCPSCSEKVMVSIIQEKEKWSIEIEGAEQENRLEDEEKTEVTGEEIAETEEPSETENSEEGQLD